ncbi:MAG: phosphoribosylamine--glycine ligase [Acidobacteria bacterium 13_1_40CM_2_60_7]|nr:MAG: phosphoribosylamine--glycine ligase [Acidobacteria bacterium 13_1_40CM_2_60_7]OLE84122.1 MAG: phosphoribosylamine--glycine ligase [Acidobacteria bacterium 13_1_20CM_2_60_10]
MKVLVIGGGGREHALVWRLKESSRVDRVVCAPGNGGILAEAECVAAEAGDVGGLVALAERLGPDLTVVGPELPLVRGIADEFSKRNWRIVGPTKRAAQIEGSKIFAKEFLRRHNIPTAELYGCYDSPGDAYSALCAVDWPVVIKADGLCAGKGVFVGPNPDKATAFIERVMEKNELGPGGRRVLLEEALEGEELTFIVVTDGERYAPLVPTRDHKRVFDGNQGPNTGGMGAFSSDDLLPPGLRQIIISNIVEPTLRGFAAEGIRYQGFLYIGLMLTLSGPKVLEFNCRLGDPEAQAIAARMDFDLAEVLNDLAAGQLVPAKLRWKPGASVCVVLASGGYPGNFKSGKRIEGLTGAGQINGVKILHAGTKRQNDSLLTSGGRVLGVTASGPTLEAAVGAAYETVGKIHFEGMHFRKDIGTGAGRRIAVGD